MLESPTSRRVEFDDEVTVEELRRTHPLRSSFLHGESIRKTSRSSTRSTNGTIRRSSSSKSIHPGKCPVHGKKVSVTSSVPDVIIPVPISRQNSSDESIGVQPIYAAPLKSALKNPNGAGIQKPQGWAGLQWALLMGCYALMLLLAVVVGVVLIQQHRQSNSADNRSGALPTQLIPGSTNEFSQRPRRGPDLSNNNNRNSVPSNQIKGTKPDSVGPPSRDLRGRPKSLTSQEVLDNSFGSQGSSRNPKFHQAGISIFSNKPSSQPSLTSSQSRQPQENQRFNPSFSNNQNRGSSVSSSPTEQSSFPGGQTRGSSFPGQQINQQTSSQQNINNRGSSPSRSPIRPSPFPLDQTRSSSFPASSSQTPNLHSSNNQQRRQPSHDQTQSSSFPGSSSQTPNLHSSNNQQRRQPSNDQSQSSSFPSSSSQTPNQPSSNNRQRNQHSLSRPIPTQVSSNNQQRNQPSLSRQIPNQPSTNTQQRNKSSHPRQRTNQSHRPEHNRRRPSSNQHHARRPSQSNVQASQLPFNNDPAVQPRFPFEQLHRPASLDKSNAPLPSLDANFTLAGNSRIPKSENKDVKIAQLWNHQNSDGSFTYGYVNTDGSFKNETRGVGGCVEGIYGYIDPVSNQEVRVPYKTGNTANNCNVPQTPWPPQAG